MPITGNLVTPTDPIPPYPAEIDNIRPYPRDWKDVVYDGAAFFEVQVQGVPAGWSISCKWAVVGNPGAHRYRLRTADPIPPGIPLQTEAFSPDVTQVWLPFLSRREIDLDHVRAKTTTFTVECVVQAKEPGLFGDKEELPLSVPITFEPALNVRDLAQLDRYALAFEYSAPYWPESVRDAAIELFTNAEAIAMMVGFTVIFIALAIAPYPWTKVVGFAFGAVLLVIFTKQTLEQLGKALADLDDDCYCAEADADLRSAGKRFAETCGEPVFNLLLALVFWRVSEWVSEKAQAYKTARLKVVEQLTADMQAAGHTPGPLPQTVLNQLETAQRLVRRMRLSEFLKAKTGLGQQFIKGVEGNKAHSLNEPYKFTYEHLKNPLNYWIEHRIELSDAILDLLKLAVDDNAIPESLKDMKSQVPRYKWETGAGGVKRLNILIPKGLWPEFMVMYNVVDIVVVLIDPTDNTGEQDEETFVVADEP